MNLGVSQALMQRVIKALKASKSANLELLISTCIIKDRVFSEEFEMLCSYCKDEDIPLYVTLAKPVGTARSKIPGFVLKKT